jgi:hypothetical protein
MTTLWTPNASTCAPSWRELGESVVTSTSAAADASTKRTGAA